MKKLPKGVEVARTEVLLTQEEDSGGRIVEDFQFIKISADDAGGGHYIVLETERWAIDGEDIDTFAEYLKSCLEETQNGN